jgi:conjugal transfer pilus assembly protein TraW
MVSKLTMAQALLAASLLPVVTASHAKDEVMTLGPTYGITEVDFLKFIENKVAQKARSGELAKIEKEALRRAKHGFENPTPIGGLSNTTRARTFYWDPTIEVNQDIKTPQGQLIAKAGTRVNPLDQVGLSNDLFFFDGRDEQQAQMALNYLASKNGKVKLILTAGSFARFMRERGERVYYDQEGTLVAKFGITQVPARVTQEARRLRIDELLVQ